jgi:hypothetical protein
MSRPPRYACSIQRDFYGDCANLREAVFWLGVSYFLHARHRLDISLTNHETWARGGHARSNSSASRLSGTKSCSASSAALCGSASSAAATAAIASAGQRQRALQGVRAGQIVGTAWARNPLAHRCRTNENPATGGQRRPVHQRTTFQTRPGGMSTATRTFTASIAAMDATRPPEGVGEAGSCRRCRSLGCGLRGRRVPPHPGAPTRAKP